MAFTAKDVQLLREKTGVGMMDCKKALTEADGDMDKAIDILREKGLAAATKKAGRIAAEGAVYAYYDEDEKVGVIVEVNSETDFVAKNSEFQNLCADVAKTIAVENPADVEALLTKTMAGSDRTVQDNINDKILSIGENMKVRRFERVPGVVSTYIHMGGSVGVMIAFDTDEATAAKAEFLEMGKNVAMQIAAMSPQYLSDKDISDEVLAKEKDILLVQIKEDPKMASKPEKVIEGIIAGRIGKFFEEVCLLKQPYVKDDSIKVEQYIESVAKELGASIQATAFFRFAKGEGLEKREDNFADEIAKMVQ
ncbi:MAG: translation elongation factor Ts [Oscillospiraceae bacterium]|jgi:elongation factor Ts|nr:translation elongation factor Ts [Oscillospiraceae bacterium]